MMNIRRARSVTRVGICLIGIVIIIVTVGGCNKTTSSSVAAAPTTSTGSYNSQNAASGAAPPPTPTETGSYNSQNAASGGGPGGGGGAPLQFSGTGSDQSAQFLVNVDTVIAQYTYDCSGEGGSGDFTADMISGDPSSPNYDDQNIADTSGSSASATVTLSPQDVGSYYNLQVTTPCSWTVTLQAG